MICSTHNHSTGSDGKLTPEQLIKKAIELGWDYVYFTDHYLLPKKILGKKDNFFNKAYIKNIKELKEEHKDKIEVYFGGEFNYLEKLKNWTENEIKKQDYDYITGAIHLLLDKKGNYQNIEPGKEEFIKNLEKFGGIKKYVKEYYKQIKNLVNSNLFDSVGHLDYIGVYNINNEFFSENEDWYKKEVLETLDLIKENKMALEINHGGIRKTGEQFPSLWILKEARKRNIPITLGIDAHYPEHYNNKFMQELIDIAKKAGYNSVVRFKNRKMIKEKLE